jgi:hypothetical protein
MAHPKTCLEATHRTKEEKQVVTTQIKKASFIPCSLPPNPSLPSHSLKIQKLTQAKMVEHQLKGIFYNCNEKYFLGHKCKEKNILWPFFRPFYEEDFPLLKHCPRSMIISHPLIPYKLN